MGRLLFTFAFLVHSVELVADPVTLASGDRIKEGTEAILYHHPSDPSRVLRVPRGDTTDASLQATEEKLRILERIGGARYGGIIDVPLPDGKLARAHVLQAFAGEPVRCWEVTNSKEQAAIAGIMRAAAELGAVLYDPQFFRVETPNGVRFVPIDPGVGMAHRMAVADARKQTERRITELLPFRFSKPCPFDLGDYPGTADGKI